MRRWVKAGIACQMHRKTPAVHVNIHTKLNLEETQTLQQLHTLLLPLMNETYLLLRSLCTFLLAAGFGRPTTTQRLSSNPDRRSLLYTTFTTTLTVKVDGSLGFPQSVLRYALVVAVVPVPYLEDGELHVHAVSALYYLRSEGIACKTVTSHRYSRQCGIFTTRPVAIERRYGAVSIRPERGCKQNLLRRPGC